MPWLTGHPACTFRRRDHTQNIEKDSYLSQRTLNRRHANEANTYDSVARETPLRTMYGGRTPVSQSLLVRVLGQWEWQTGVIANAMSVEVPPGAAGTREE